MALQYAIGMWGASLRIYLMTFNRSAAMLTLKVSFVIVGVAFFVGGRMLFHSATGAAAGLAMSLTLTTTASLVWFTPWRDSETGGEDAGEDSAAAASKANQMPSLLGDTT